MNETNDSRVDQGDGLGEQTSPASDDRFSTLEEDTEQVDITDGKYWSEQVAILRRENAELFYDKQWA
eukprot:7005423-Karenia_brevis.AAC.1